MPAGGKGDIPFADPAGPTQSAPRRLDLETTMPAPVPSRSRWRAEVYRNPGIDFLFVLFWAVVLGLFLVILLSPQTLWGVPTMLGITAVLSLATAAYLSRLNNLYQLHCARVCAEHGDLIGGIDFAFSVHRFVDAVEIAYVLVSLAKLADQRGHADWARALLVRARDRWQSPHAMAALGELDGSARATRTARG